MKQLSVSLFLFVFASIANAEIEKSVAKCAAMPGDLERLECYDLVAAEYRLASPIVNRTEIEGIGKWDVSDSINPIDDSRTVVLSLLAESGKSKWGSVIPLLIRCKSNTTSLYIGWGDYLGSEAEVLTRVGSAKAKTQEWSLSTDKQATFYPGSPISFIRNLFNADKFVAQVTPYNESPVTAIFDIRGLKAAAEPLMETCGWTAELTPEEVAKSSKAECDQAKQHLADLRGAGLSGTSQFTKTMKIVNKCNG